MTTIDFKKGDLLTPIKYDHNYLHKCLDTKTEVIQYYGVGNAIIVKNIEGRGSTPYYADPSSFRKATPEEIAASIARRIKR